MSSRIEGGLPAARTRTRPPDAGGFLLAAGQVVQSPESGARYRVEGLLGQGGFGQVFRARRLVRSARMPSVVCLKASRHIDGWVREAYFGRLLDGHARAIRVYEAFPLPTGAGILYCLVLEYARHGDLRAFLRRTRAGWRESVARREIAGVLSVLDTLHRGQVLHRDLTPMNVFVCGRQGLKLGDFGIVRQQGDRRGVKARTWNPHGVPSEIRARAVPMWQARDDVYQVGQLLAMLIKGDAEARVRTPEVRRLPCSDQLKEIVYRCIGERRKRYQSADELIAALRARPASLKAGVLRTLKGVHLAFTGVLSRKRREAVRAAKRAGAIVHGGPSAKTTVVVRGRPNPLQAAGAEGGRKLLELKRLREKGHRITVLREDRFWQLAAPPAGARP
jgi:serine/threonine-protein kinase